MQLKSLEATQNFSKHISQIISAGDIIFLYGEIGVGKTTFVRFIVNYLENKNKIKNSEVLSPTFNINQIPIDSFAVGLNRKVYLYVCVCTCLV